MITVFCVTFDNPIEHKFLTKEARRDFLAISGEARYDLYESKIYETVNEFLINEEDGQELVNAVR